MKKIYPYCFCLAVLFLVCSSLAAQSKPEYSAFNIPAELMENANTVVRLHYEDIQVRSPKLATVSQKVVKTIFNKKNDDHHFFFPYDKFSKLGKIKVKIYDSLGNLVREVKKSEFEDRSAVSDYSLYEDDRYKYIEVVHDAFPYTVEVEYDYELKGLMSFPSFWVQPFYTSVIKAQYIVRVPTSMQLNYKVLNSNAEPLKRRENGLLVHTWNFGNLTAIEYEAYAPEAAKILPRLLLNLDQFQVENYTGSFANWNDFGRFVYRLNSGRDELSAAMKAKVLDLVKDAKSDIEKIDILYRYLQTNMRYVSVQLGIGGWQTFDAKYVEKNKYGDCKALTNFMKAMLKVAGIKSKCAYIYTGEVNREIYEDFPMLGFNHVILNVPNQNRWLECTSKSVPPNYIGSSNANRYALLVGQAKSELVKTPALGADHHFHESEVAIQLLPNGTAHIDFQSSLHGPKQDGWRTAKFYLSESKLEDLLRKMCSFTSFKIESFEIDPNAEKPLTEVQYKINVPKFASKAGRRLFIPINQLNRIDDLPPINEERIHPIVCHEDYRENDRFVFQLPEGYEVESIPQKAVHLDTPYGYYQVDVRTEGDQLIYHRQLQIKPVALPASDYGAFRDFYKAVDKADKMKVVLVKKRT
ncbi:MAG: DUF3857 domain-containing protein [Bacteroidota bacterium]